MSDILKDYIVFVDGVMSKTSADKEEFLKRMLELKSNETSISVLLTAALGLAGESGEIADIVKKVFFQGKELNTDLKLKLQIEAGDVLWYIAALCIALNIPFETLVRDNIKKLETRYPGGVFSIERSENRKI